MKHGRHRLIRRARGAVRDLHQRRQPTDPPTPVYDVIQRGALGDVRDAEIWSLNPG
ncbi:hypothetical protein [Sorangium sp. So ce394]|uniref:hypothetical protein n=1 Tax=Sorangium sp. So ce394 TaxID=3133310 RepID=UPI003F5C6B6B